jgi:hypothetical protein
VDAKDAATTLLAHDPFQKFEAEIFGVMRKEIASPE